MPIVLIVDDSEVDRRLVGGLLPKELEWLIEFADNGVSALEKMRLSLPDVVITDMMMPEMDGMELVSNIRVDYPHVPVILITGHGSETLAVEALQRGATSYVPKRLLAEKLLETVEQVLACRAPIAATRRLIGCLENTQYIFRLGQRSDSDPAAGRSAATDAGRHAMLRRNGAHACRHCAGGSATQCRPWPAIWRWTRQQAQQARSELRQGHVSELVLQRSAQAALMPDRVTHVKADISLNKATFVIRDEGQGVRHIAAFRTGTTRRRSSTVTGRGLVLMKNFMDEVHFNESGNEVTMIMHCNGHQ